MPKFTTLPRFAEETQRALSVAEAYLAPVLERASREDCTGIVYEVDDNDGVHVDETGRIYVELHVIGTYDPTQPGSAHRAYVCVELTESFKPIRHDFDKAVEAAIDKAHADAEVYYYESYRE